MAIDRAPIRYEVSFRQTESHRIDVIASIPTDTQATIELMQPVWTPGSYLVREYARQIESITVTDSASGRALGLEKKSKNRWVVQCDNASEVTVRYTLYCREMGVRTNWVEHDFAFLTGAATFLTRLDALDREHIVRLEALPSWPQVATSLKTATDSNGVQDKFTRVAQNYDELVDSPIVVGEIDIQSFEAGGAVHYLATIGTDQLWNTQAALKDVKRIVEQEQALWRVVPYKEYWFLNLATESGGGLEHNNSSVLMTSRWTMKQKSKYTDWLSLVSHEFFHTWNVRRLRPKALVQYDYENEQYTKELWVAEGITSYYDNLLVARSGLMTPKEYLEKVNKEISGVQTSPGRLHQSLSESSFDAWIKFYRPDENSSNSRISYYTKGAIVALLLDTEIRYATQNQKSLDDVMRSLWTNQLETGYTNEDVIRTVNQTAGVDLSGWLKSAIYTTDEMSFKRLLDFYGLEWKLRESQPDATSEKPGNAFVGLDLKNNGGLCAVDKVVKDSPAAICGINVGDELIAIEGYRISTESWNDRIGFYRPGDKVTILLSRRGKIIEVQLRLGEQPKELWTLQRVAKPTEEQEERWKNWLNLPKATSETAPTAPNK